jgi:hypothetical protein
MPARFLRTLLTEAPAMLIDCHLKTLVNSRLFRAYCPLAAHLDSVSRLAAADSLKL